MAELTFVGFSDAVFSDPQGRTITCNLVLPSGSVVPFTASLDDIEPHGAIMHAELLAAGNVAPYRVVTNQPPPSSPLSAPRRVE